jgi:hypothetical protein
MRVGCLSAPTRHANDGPGLVHELVYFRSEHIEGAEATRALAAWLLVHDINSELHPLTVDGQGYDRSAFWDAIKIVRECSP